MTDKEKIRAEIERLRKSYQIKYQELDCTSPEIMSVCAKRNLCQDILFFIDSMQEEPKKCMYSKDNYTDEDRKVLCEDCKEKCAYAIAGVISTNAQIKKEPVCEDMWEASKQYALRQVLASTDEEMSEQDYLRLRLFSGLELAVAHKDGAQWKKKQQMMKKAFSVEIGKQRPDYKCVLNGNFFKYDTGDKVKLIIIEED